MIIYKVTNILNNKIYIGQTIRSLDQRRKEHYKNSATGEKSYFYSALRKHSQTFFKWEVVGECFTKKELNEAEKICIEFFQSNNSIYGYNGTSGGTGGAIRFGPAWNSGKSGIYTQEHKSKISIAIKKARKINPGLWDTPRKPMSDETKKKISDANKRKPPKYGAAHSAYINVDVECIKQLYDEGLTIPAIAHKLNINSDLVRVRLSAIGITCTASEAMKRYYARATIEDKKKHTHKSYNRKNK